MKNKYFILLLIALIPAIIFITFFTSKVLAGSLQLATDTVQVKPVAQAISAGGSIHSENEATLHFQTGGKLVYLPFKKGDAVYQGQTIAQLDTYALQKQLEAALNAYRITRDTFDQTQSNSQNNVLQTQQQGNFPGIQADKTNAINDAVKRILDETQGALDNSVINVELSNYALQLASLTAPFNGIILTEDVTTANVNITPATSFVIVDPNKKVFRANIAASDIDFVSVGSPATIKLDGSEKIIHGTVETIYPQKVILPTGEQVYEVDVTADGLTSAAFGQNGSVLIASNNGSSALMVPSWVIVGHKYVWVWNGKMTVLKPVHIGATHDDMTEIISGLDKSDKVIVTPKSVAKTQYNML